MEMFKREEDEEQIAFNIMIKILKYIFHTLSFTLLSLLLPLSFLVLGRLSANTHFLTYSNNLSNSFFLTISLKTSPFILRIILTFTCFATLIYSLTGRLPRRPCLACAWAALGAFQVCVSLGTHASISTGLKPAGVPSNHYFSWIERFVIFVGLYETMLIWGKLFVKPVADDTIFGVPLLKEEKTNEIILVMAFLALWLSAVQVDAVELVLFAGKRGLGFDGFVDWFVGHATVTAGIVNIVKFFMKVLKCLFSSVCREKEDDLLPNYTLLNSEV